MDRDTRADNLVWNCMVLMGSDKIYDVKAAGSNEDFARAEIADFVTYAQGNPVERWRDHSVWPSKLFDEDFKKVIVDLGIPKEDYPITSNLHLNSFGDGVREKTLWWLCRKYGKDPHQFNYLNRDWRRERDQLIEVKQRITNLENEIRDYEATLSDRKSSLGAVCLRKAQLECPFKEGDKVLLTSSRGAVLYRIFERIEHVRVTPPNGPCGKTEVEIVYRCVKSGEAIGDNFSSREYTIAPYTSEG